MLSKLRHWPINSLAMGAPHVKCEMFCPRYLVWCWKCNCLSTVYSSMRMDAEPTRVDLAFITLNDVDEAHVFVYLKFTWAIGPLRLEPL